MVHFSPRLTFKSNDDPERQCKMLYFSQDDMKEVVKLKSKFIRSPSRRMIIYFVVLVREIFYFSLPTFSQ